MPLSESGQVTKAKMQRAARMQDALRAKLAFAENMRIIINDATRTKTHAHACEKLHMVECQINVISDQLASEINAVQTAINGLNDPTAQAIIEMRYMLGWTWPKIAHEINYSERQAQRIHNKAIEEINLNEI